MKVLNQGQERFCKGPLGESLTIWHCYMEPSTIIRISEVKEPLFITRKEMGVQSDCFLRPLQRQDGGDWA